MRWMKAILFVLHSIAKAYGFCPGVSTQQIVDQYTKNIVHIDGGTMRKTNIFLTMAVTLVLMAGVAFGQINDVAAQKEGPVGIVVAYVPGQSITIMDQQGVQSEFMLDPSLKIVPPGSETSLTVGSFVTVIAPASLDKGKQIAVGLVVHPKVPDGWKPSDPSDKDLLTSATPLVKNTAGPTDPAVTATPKVSETPTPAEFPTATPTPAPNANEDGTAADSNSFIEWLKSLFRQVLSQ